MCADTVLNRTTKSRRGGDRRTRERDLKEIRSCRRTKGRLSEKKRERGRQTDRHTDRDIDINRERDRDREPET